MLPDVPPAPRGHEVVAKVQCLRPTSGAVDSRQLQRCCLHRSEWAASLDPREAEGFPEVKREFFKT